MLAAGPLLAAAAETQSNLVPILSAIGGILLGLGGFAAVLTARANRQNYVTGGFRDLTDASAKEAEQERQRASDERAAKERAEYQRDRWRNYAFQLVAQLAAAGITPTATPPTEHPSEAP